MTPIQQPLGSGFGPTSTAADVLAGINLAGRTALVTGGYSGLGLEITRALVGAGAVVLVPARRPEVAQDVLAAEIAAGSVRVAPLDLSDLDSVKAYADALLAESLGGGSPAAAALTLDIIITNAGIMACPETRVGDGWEAQFATNHLGHFALVNRLWPLLVPDARVVAVSSAANRMGGMHWDDVHFTSGYDRWQAYAQSKTANVLFAVGLDLRAEASGIHAYSCHPGYILTPLQRHLTTDEMVEMGWIDANGNAPGFKTITQGAATAVWAATSALIAQAGPVYCGDADVATPDQVASWSTDPEEAERLWAYSAKLTGVDAFAVV